MVKFGRAWTVVVFPETNEAEIVPSNWLKYVRDDDDETVCFWPPFMNSESVSAAIRKRVEPDEKWKQHKAVVKYSTGTVT